MYVFIVIFNFDTLFVKLSSKIALTESLWQILLYFFLCYITYFKLFITLETSQNLKWLSIFLDPKNDVLKRGNVNEFLYFLSFQN